MDSDYIRQVAEACGLKGNWVMLKAVWDGQQYVYFKSYNGKDWVDDYEEDEVVSIRYCGGPKDGLLEA